MASRYKRIPLSQFIAIGLGVALCTVETWLNAEFVAKTEGLASSLVAAVVVASIGAAAALPYAERSLKAGQWFKAVAFSLFFAFMVAFSLGASVDRIGTKRDTETASARGDNKRVALAREAYEAAKATKEAECTKRGPKCRAAEEAVTKARESLSAKPAERIEDSMAARISAVMPFVTAEQVALFQPLALPLALQLGGFLMLSFGFAPKREEKLGQTRRKRQNRKRKSPQAPRPGRKALGTAANVVPFQSADNRAVN